MGATKVHTSVCPHISTLPAPASGAETAHKSTRATRIPHLALRAPQEKKKRWHGTAHISTPSHIPRLALRAPQEARRVNEDGAHISTEPRHPSLSRTPCSTERKVRGGSAHIHSVTDPLHPLHSPLRRRKKVEERCGNSGLHPPPPHSCPPTAVCVCVRCAALPLPLAKYPVLAHPPSARNSKSSLSASKPRVPAVEARRPCKIIARAAAAGGGAAKGVAVAVRPKGLLLLRVCGSPKVAEGGLVVSGVGGAGGLQCIGASTEGRHGRREKRRREKGR
ncbi:hypothetical protein B0H14DRAFT_3599912 [Mycena olivaceomarginata]|nr:hypothetical protein B0H14DRAFT_3599912 [Mycena olivaceomarginata]